MKQRRGHPTPPRIAERLLMRIYSDSGSGSSAGDFEEVFQEIARDRGAFAARAWYRLQILASLPAFFSGRIKRSLSMFADYMKVAFRHFKNQKSFTLINLTGLTAGIACGLVIFLYVGDELSYDRYHTDLDRIYRVAVRSQRPEGSSLSATVCAPVAQVLRDHFPQVETAARAFPVNGGLVERGAVKFYEETRIFADTGLFDILTIPFVQGDPGSALDRPYTIVVTERLAEKYFGREAPLGQTLRINDRDYEITGVVADAPANTHFPYHSFVSMNTLEGRYPFDRWFLSNFYIYVKLRPGARAAALAEGLAGLAESYAPSELLNPEEKVSYRLQPVAGIHLHSHARSEPSPCLNPVYLYLFSAVGLFVLLIAGMNFVNLSTARSAKRAREVGIRKVMGAGRRQLIRRFFSESFVIILLAMILALAAVGTVLPFVNSISGKALSAADLFRPALWVFIPGLILFMTAAAGAYPAVYLSSFQPEKIIKNQLHRGSKASSLRRILVVFQFAVTIALIAGTLVIFNQIGYMKNRALGFDMEQKMVIPVRGRLSIERNYPAVKAAFRRHAGVTGAVVSYKLPGTTMDRWDTDEVGGETGQTHVLNHLYVGPDYIPEFGIEMIAGRAFSRDIPSDINGAFILNRSASAEYGWTPEEALGKRLESIFPGTVIGVTEDFHYQGLQRVIEPLALAWRPRFFNNIILSFHRASLTGVLAHAGAQWSTLFPESPFEYYFLDDYFNRQYRSEERIGRMFTAFTILGVIIAGLGLFGLSAFTAEQRTREIGIRKVLGAGRSEIMLRLALDFTKWVLAANLIALPVAWLTMKGWLDNFAYRAAISPLILAAASAAALVIAMAAVGVQAFRAASADPIRSIRRE